MTTPTEPLAEVLARAEWAVPAVGAGDIAGWPAGTVERLERLGLLAEVGPAEAFACDACGLDHVELVQWARAEGVEPRAYIPCPAERVVWVDRRALRRWAVRAPVLAERVAAAVGAAGAAAERVPGRVWKLGTVRAAGRAATAFLAAGLARADGAAVVEMVPELRAATALVLVPAAVPPPAVWAADRAPVVLVLTDLLSLGPDGLTADRELLSSALAPAGRPVPKVAARTFPTPRGATWEQVVLAVAERHLRVRVGERVEQFTFAEAGFADRRAADAPDELWALLGVLARYGGEIPTGDAVRMKPAKLKQKVGVLRDRLRALLVLDADPFRPTRPGQPYRARFTIRRDGPLTFPTPPGAGWDDLTLTEAATGLDVAVTADARGVALEFADEGREGQWAGTVERGERHARYTLADLGLTDAAGDPTPAGAALVALLRTGGRLPRPERAPELLALGQALARFFQLDAPPLDFDRKRGIWVTRFEAASVVPVSDRS